MINNYTTLKGAMTKLPVFDMTGTGLATRQAFRLMIPELISKAEQFLKVGALELSVGTYTARDLHCLLNKIYKNYYQRDKAPLCLFTQSCPIDVDSIQWMFHDSGTYNFSWFHVFYILWKCEIEAGWSGPKVHKFIVEDKRECVSESTITFSEEKQAKKLSSMVRRNNFPEDKPCQMSLSNGCIRCTYSAFHEKDYKGRIHKRSIEAYDGFLLSPLEFSAPNDFSDLCVRFDGKQLSHLYGECKLRIFMNEKGDGTNQNPNNIRVTIENPDGWIVASDIIEYQIKYLDIEDLNEKQHESAQHEAADCIFLPAKMPHNYKFINDIKGRKEDTNTLTIWSADNQNERNMQIHQTAQLCLPYRKLSSPSLVPSREESIQQTSPLSSSPVINHLCMQIEIEQMDHIRKLYGEGKLRVYIKKASNGGCNNPYDISLLIQTEDGWIVDNEFLKYKHYIPIRGKRALPNHLLVTPQLKESESSPSASALCGIASAETAEYSSQSTHTFRS